MADLNGATDLPLGVVGSVTKWLAHPFSTEGSALNWVLWLGLVLCAVFFWSRVLAHIERAVPEV